MGEGDAVFLVIHDGQLGGVRAVRRPLGAVSFGQGVQVIGGQKGLICRGAEVRVALVGQAVAPDTLQDVRESVDVGRAVVRGSVGPRRAGAAAPCIDVRRFLLICVDLRRCSSTFIEFR